VSYNGQVFRHPVKTLHELLKIAAKINHSFNPLMGTLKQQSNGPLYNNTVISTLAVDRWTVTFGIARPHPVPSLLYHM